MISKEERKRFQKLRRETLQSMKKELEYRLKHNPIPTELELKIGAFLEELEPQVREAIGIFFQKGYSTDCSGFDDDGESQVINGFFKINQKTKRKLERIGVQVLKGSELSPPVEEGQTHIRLKTAHPSLHEIKATWDRIAALLPPLKRLVYPSLKGSTEEFLKKYAPQRYDLELLMVKKRLVVSDSPYYMRRSKIRIKELAKLIRHSKQRFQ